MTQAFVRQEINSGFFRKLIDVHGENNVGVAQASAVFVPLLQLKSQLFLGAMALLGGYGVLRWHGWLHMEVGDLVMFFFLASLFFDPVQVIGNQLNQAFMAMAGAERLFRMLDQKPEWVDAPDSRAVADHQRARGIPGGAFRVQAGTAGADGHFICGRAGTERRAGGAHRQRQDDARGIAAKILPADRRTRVGGWRGLEHVTSESLRSQMGSVQQNNFLFSGTVLDNIRLARPEAKEADVRATLAALDCADLLEALPHGLHTRVAERGTALSFGQRQLICFRPRDAGEPAHRGAGRGDQRD